KDIDVGLITEINLAPDCSGVIATAELVKGAESRVVEDTRFWVVRPRVSGSTVSGLQTLLSGSYVAMDVGKSTERARVFSGLEQPPAFTTDSPGRQLTLRAEDIGSLDVGSPVYYRRLQVGQVAAYELEKDGKAVKVTVFINAPYDRFVSGNSRFWHASGIDMALDAEGVRIKTESLVSIAIGIRVYRERFPSRLRGGRPRGGRVQDGQVVAGLVDRGLRAQLRTGSLRTGQLYVALDFFPEAPRAKLDLAQSPPELPTTP